MAAISAQQGRSSGCRSLGGCRLNRALLIDGLPESQPGFDRRAGPCWWTNLRTFLTTLLIEAVLVLETLAALTPRAAAQHIPSDGGAIASRVGPVYPLRASANGRYLIDQSDVPFLMVGDSPQNLIANLSVPEAASYMANRRTYGINTLWINLLCGACNKEGKTFDGITPFTVVGDLSTPNPAYFRRADDMISLARNLWHGSPTRSYRDLELAQRSANER